MKSVVVVVVAMRWEVVVGVVVVVVTMRWVVVVL
jgi:hypothetical protein